jgi:hypothetical protein
MRGCVAAIRSSLAILCGLAIVAPAGARRHGADALPEGTAHGFVVLTDTAGEELAPAASQWPDRGGRRAG